MNLWGKEDYYGIKSIIDDAKKF
ncbi:Putative uncharacterized protein [Lactococcus lactis subsp. lactis A12]|uniref:Uncharacterized protein n=1 Tax=Lactococcus lactis subsp. lactis A12 TaxID=1137134 RepID=S6FEP0_LACLL|nr:Putative uncharacterized protein [Lactococcus lactis subsp. lactis A12]SBW29611.1 Hypothetical protein LLA12_00436 [Lactococcus lactis subsp. lactis]